MERRGEQSRKRKAAEHEEKSSSEQSGCEGTAIDGEIAWIRTRVERKRIKESIDEPNERNRFEYF